jgi:hypothetical protein
MDFTSDDDLQDSMSGSEGEAEQSNSEPVSSSNEQQEAEDDEEQQQEEGREQQEDEEASEAEDIDESSDPDEFEDDGRNAGSNSEDDAEDGEEGMTELHWCARLCLVLHACGASHTTAQQLLDAAAPSCVVSSLQECVGVRTCMLRRYTSIKCCCCDPAGLPAANRQILVQLTG